MSVEARTCKWSMSVRKHVHTMTRTTDASECCKHVLRDKEKCQGAIRKIACTHERPQLIATFSLSDGAG